jgi:hypothetical protein
LLFICESEKEVSTCCSYSSSLVVFLCVCGEAGIFAWVAGQSVEVSRQSWKSVLCTNCCFQIILLFISEEFLKEAKRGVRFLLHMQLECCQGGGGCLIPQDPSNAGWVNNLCHSTGFHVMDLILACVASQLLRLKWNNDSMQLDFKRKLLTHSRLQIHLMLSVYL